MQQRVRSSLPNRLISNNNHSSVNKITMKARAFIIKLLINLSLIMITPANNLRIYKWKMWNYRSDSRQRYRILILHIMQVKNHQNRLKKPITNGIYLNNSNRRKTSQNGDSLSSKAAALDLQAAELAVWIWLRKRKKDNLN